MNYRKGDETMGGDDTLALIDNIVADYNRPKYKDIQDFVDSELSLLTMQVENLKRKVEFLRTGEFWTWQRKRKNKQ